MMLVLRFALEKSEKLSFKKIITELFDRTFRDFFSESSKNYDRNRACVSFNLFPFPSAFAERLRIKICFILFKKSCLKCFNDKKSQSTDVVSGHKLVVNPFQNHFHNFQGPKYLF